MTTLVTGGAGYIGRHVVHELVDADEQVIVLDDLSAGYRSGWSPVAPLFVGDCGDRALVKALVDKHKVSAIIHLAGSSVSDFDRDRADDHRRSAEVTRHLIETAAACGLRHFIFASTAVVYGDPKEQPLSEEAPALPISPYGRGKLMSEVMLKEAAAAHDFRYVILRLFEVAGVDPRQRRGIESGHFTGLLTRATEAALGWRPNVRVSGTNYPTPDGTSIRDYIHVCDVARALTAALTYLRTGGANATFNCGCGRGHSVLEVIKAVERVGGRSVPVRYLEPPLDEPAALVADARHIRSALVWAPRFDDLDAIATHVLTGELRRPELRDDAADPFLSLVVETGVAPTELRKIISAFGRQSRSALGAGSGPVAVSPSASTATSILRSDLQAAKHVKKLTIGMATYDDYDGVYFTLQGIRLYHPDILSDVEFVVVDNNPSSPCGRALKDLSNSIENYRYIPKGEISGTAVRDWVFHEARGEFVLCIDCHILIAGGALKRLIDYVKAHAQTKDLLQGPLIHDNLKDYSTHFNPEWQAGMYGTWGADPAGADPDLPPFEIPMQGLGMFACRRAAWPGFNAAFRGFGGEEGYIHEKFRQRGGKVLCLPFLRWMHRFNRPLGTSYANRWEDRVRNYLIGFGDLGWETAPVVEHFKTFLGEQVWSRIVGRLDPDLLPLPARRPVEPNATAYEGDKEPGVLRDPASDGPPRL
jgi:UDP-glucose-4-epimerase GalE